MKRFAMAAALCAAGWAAPVSAHVTFERDEAAIGAPYKGVLRVPHGCEGEPTLAIRVFLPDEIVSAKPMPKPGWSLSTKTGPYSRAVSAHGRSETSGVREIEWSGGRLDNAHVDEFAFFGVIAAHAQPGPVHVRVVQDCASAKLDWSEVATPGGARPAFPAPSIRLAAADGAPAAAEPTYRAGALVITAPWTRATPKGAPVAGGYVRIVNTGAEADRLVGGVFENAGRVEVHEMAMDGGVMRMRELRGGLEIRPGETIELKPGGLHLMFLDLKTPVATGAPVKGRLTFEKAGSVDVEFTVAPLGATTPGGGGAASPRGGGHGHGHGHH